MLRTPHALFGFCAALVGRLSYGTVFLSLALAVKESTGSFSMLGTVTALFGFASVLGSPVRAALVDRYGPRRALPPMAFGYAVALGGLALATSRPGAPGLLLAVLAAVAGLGTPPLGPTMRALWSDLLPDRALLQRAYSLDTVAEELLYVTGPLLVGLLIQVAPPWTGVAASALLILSGSLALAWSPALRARPAGTTETAGTGETAGTIGSTGADGADGAAAARPYRALSRRPRRPYGAALGRAIGVAAGLGMALGAVELLVIAVADEHGRPGTVPWTMAALSAGSAIGGLAYGAVRWRVSTMARLGALGAALGLTLAAMGLFPHPYPLIAMAALGGVCVAPALTTAYLIADETAAREARTRAITWIGTAFNAGSSASAGAVGLLVERVPLPVCFLAAALPVLLSAAVALGRRSAGRDPGPARPAEVSA
ncbi:MFS transporter [Bailinhaonella thermotolerans]|uniref:MFS transporter n=1 Tax=Bailinhaonella thermotolerans TaxID=1070861 RepID=A0A3A4B6S2_9ACTN|nr:MFS transporter [Bailinhaonella thermotolerans]